MPQGREHCQSHAHKPELYPRSRDGFGEEFLLEVVLVVYRYQAHEEPVSERGRDDAKKIAAAAAAAARTRRPIHHCPLFWEWIAQWKHRVGLSANTLRDLHPSEVCDVYEEGTNTAGRGAEEMDTDRGAACAKEAPRGGCAPPARPRPPARPPAPS